jgi:hypothetical protein
LCDIGKGKKNQAAGGKRIVSPQGPTSTEYARQRSSYSEERKGWIARGFNVLGKFGFGKRQGYHNPNQGGLGHEAHRIQTNHNANGPPPGQANAPPGYSYNPHLYSMNQGNNMPPSSQAIPPNYAPPPPADIQIEPNNCN